MRERIAQILKLVCLGLAALLVVQLVQAGFRANPLAGVKIPDVPSLPADTNAPPAVAAKGPGKPGTNSSASAMGSNGPATALGTNAAALGTNAVAMGTNAAAHPKTRPVGSNAVAAAVAAEPESTNKTSTVEAQTNVAAAGSAGTNVVVRHKAREAATNSAPIALESESLATNNPLTNFSASVGANTNISLTLPPNTNVFVTVVGDTNVALPKVAGGTNAAVTERGKTNGTNAAMARAAGAGRPPPTSPQMAGMMGGPGGPGGAAKAAKLPPEIQARVDRVVESEIFAPINHPVPMALLGIAGKVAFLRAPSGQTGMVKEGDSLGEIKLLRVGINRVLVEQDGQPKELMIFSGLGGESLLPKPTTNSDETIKH